MRPLRANAVLHPGLSAVMSQCYHHGLVCLRRQNPHAESIGVRMQAVSVAAKVR